MEAATDRSQPNTQRASLGGVPGGRFAAWPALLLVAFALRLHRLGAQSLWFDEAVTLRLATSTLPEIVADRAANIHPPFYFFLMKAWVDLVDVHVFADRYASVLLSLLLVPAAFVLARRWLGRAAAWAATLLAAFAPLFVIYAQELRVYALLPLVGLLLLYQTQQLFRGATQPQWVTTRDWLWYGLLLWVGLHLHYVVAFLAAYVALWSLVALWRRQPELLRAWLLTHLLVALFSLPWLLAVAGNWHAVQRELTAGYEMAEPAPLPFVVEQIWLFHWTGLAGAVGEASLRWLGRALAVLLALLFLWRRPPTRRQALGLLAHWGLPLAAAFLLWSVRASAHPRYVTLFALPLFLLAARLLAPSTAVAPRRARRLAPAAVLSAVLVLLAGQALTLYFEHPTVGKKDDMRGVAYYLQETAAAQDLIVAPYEDWSLAYEYGGDTPLLMPDLQDRDTLWADLNRHTRHTPAVFLVQHDIGSLDWQQLLPFALERAGVLRRVVSFDGLTVYVYQLQQAVTAPTPESLSARVGPLRLVGADVEARSTADGAVAVALSWQHTAPDAHDYRLSLALRDVDGWPLHQVDEPLVSAAGRGTSGWPQDEPLTTYHLLPIPPGTPPLTYTIAAELYTVDEEGIEPLQILDAQGEPGGPRLDLGITQLTAAAGASAYGLQPQPPDWEEPVAVAPGLELLAAAPDREVVVPGQSVFVRLRWRATSSSLPELHPDVGLWRDGEPIATVQETPLLDRYPTSRWARGEMVAEHRRLDVSAEADGGPAQLVMTLGEQRVTLGEVSVDAVARQFEPPPVAFAASASFGQVARLVGFDLPQTRVEPGQPIALTLYWEALASDAEPPYTVFTHLLAPDGRIVAQDDAPPDQGRRPTNSWLAGEYVADLHHLLPEEQDAGGGPLRLAVGLYDPQSGERLPMPDGSDAFVLPVQVTIATEE
ncbi:MAG TPA: glycosyltransferase family 39 protein [Candidatus Sulfomarinibacteraceae bacterium]|nr:glycosyltransferase family 39 protein [Candidatus Sulfomarinibacteraceae bacterium]